MIAIDLASSARWVSIAQHYSTYIVPMPSSLMYPVTLLLPARGYRVLGGYTGPLHAGGYRSGGYTLLLPGFCTPHPYGTVHRTGSSRTTRFASKVRSAHGSNHPECMAAE